MNVVIFGATGMVGQGALRECLLDAEVKRVASVGRRAIAQQHPKLTEVVLANLYDADAIVKALSGTDWDACFFCLGVASAGMSEADYSRVTHDLTIAVASHFAKEYPSMTFIYVSGMGTDSSERGRTMWARVKGRTENELLRMPFKAAYMFRPGLIVPMHGIKSRTALYRIFYILTTPILPLLKAGFPKLVTTTEKLGRAMLIAARYGVPKHVLETSDINAHAAGREK